MQNICNLINLSVQKGKNYLVITDLSITAIEKNILENYGFYLSSIGYIRGISTQMSNIGNVQNDLKDLVREIPALLPTVLNVDTNKNIENSFFHSFSLEKKLWPLKVVDAEIPCFIVPIKPCYARELFDTTAAKQHLFGATPNLIWNKENVYYRNINPNIETFPARILWYASAEKNSSRQKAIVCSSYLDEVVTGPAKKIFNKFKKFGIYSWERDILPLAKGNPEKNIKILRFSNSEDFINPVSITAIKKILKNNGESDNNFQSPLRIKPRTFIEIYSLGKK